jgi:hypothetical protein
VRSCIVSEEGLEEGFDPLQGQRIEPQLCIIRLALPIMVILRTVADKQEHPCQRQPFNHQMVPRETISAL